MAEEEPKVEEAPKPKRNMLVIGLIGVNVLLVIGAAAYFFFFQGSSSASDETAKDEAAAEPTQRFGPLVEMNPIVANLGDLGETRYVKVTLHLEVATEEQKIKLEEMMIPIRDRMVLHFSGLTSEQIVGEAFKTGLKVELAKLVNEVAGGELVRNVYFGEFVVQ